MQILEAVLSHPPGDRTSYRLDPRPIDIGAQAEVIGGIHKPSGIRIAFKRLHTKRNPEAVARMKREIDCALEMKNERHIMPVADHSPTYDWFVMPLAEGNATAYLDALRADDRKLQSLILALCKALQPAHLRGWIHRDIKPQNILCLDGEWVLADWGLGRRPRGETTDSNRTRVGTLFGTEGFAAPELSEDAHSAGPAADIYSVGQVIGWAVTGKWPRANIPLLPSHGPWRWIVQATTNVDPSLRVYSTEVLHSMLIEQFDMKLGQVIRQLATLANARKDPQDGSNEFMDLFAMHSGELEVIEAALPLLSERDIEQTVIARPLPLLCIMEQSAEMIDRGRVRDGKLVEDWARKLFYAVRKSAEYEQIELLERMSLILWSHGRWWTGLPLKAIVTSWLRQASGETAQVLARTLRQSPGITAHFQELTRDLGVSSAIRLALGATQ